MLLLPVILFMGCQEEYAFVTEPDEDKAFRSGDTLAGLISRVTLKDGSFDNLIDRCSEISINFPYSVRIKNQTVDITSPDDIERIRQEFYPFNNSIIINFPVTVTYSDYSEAVLPNRGALQKIQNEYNKNKEDDDIECIDFIYPIDISLYDTKYQKPESLRTGNDKELHCLFKNKNDFIIEIGYPVVVEIADGTTVNIHNNLELVSEIINAIGSCDEHDEVDFGDDNKSEDE